MELLNHIDGRWVPSTGEGMTDVNPSDVTDVLGEYGAATEDVAQSAVAAAAAAFPAWSQSSVQQRFDVLDRAGSLILERRQELGRLLAREEGKTVGEATAEATRAGQIFKFFAGEALRGGGELLPSVREGLDVEILRRPVGVIALITPWNFPIAIPAWKVAPALAFGNTVVLKPAELVPACAVELVRILEESGLPSGVLNLVLGSGAVVGDALVRSPSVSAVSFTGSDVTGRGVAAACAAAGKRVQVEMGGKNPLVVLDDADLTVAVEAAVNGAFFSTGQRCTASSRLIVTAGIHDRFVDAVQRRLATLTIGHALEAATDIGPVVDRRQLDKDLEYLVTAAQEGGEVLGGDRVDRPTDGFFMSPALVLSTTNEMRINQEEVFGPVASVIRVENYDEALTVANDTRFGLSAGICSTSLAAVTHFKRHAEAGMVMVNAPTAGVDYHVPFGGSKASSYGPREQGSYAREFFTTVKTVYVNPGQIDQQSP
ncbi:aldehyde dehydrogenase family protein [Blastococcus sp. CT_GayMR20]|uniref:aldehyde dehydrogenase family protein n=1 Tax=Blastococcus sp. CT_GayMR20 TaxID=2559609 RepID=UPI00107416B0|nr:aldehyde dehydrogenase family protein [Blastococcus sp. CT_GayMR20]TFV70589.1 aldehyde dehydrogenase family protein [Blastococcus sp. CT_GayMR20]